MPQFRFSKPSIKPKPEQKGIFVNFFKPVPDQYRNFVLRHPYRNTTGIPFYREFSPGIPFHRNSGRSLSENCQQCSHKYKKRLVSDSEPRARSAQYIHSKNQPSQRDPPCIMDSPPSQRSLPRHRGGALEQEGAGAAAGGRAPVSVWCCAR